MIKIFDLGYNVKIVFEGDKEDYLTFLNYTVTVNGSFKLYKEPGWMMPKENIDFDNLKNNFKCEFIKQPWDNIGNDMKLKPFPYQKEVIYHAFNNPESLLVLPPGAGKTVIGIGFYLELLKHNKTEKPCIVCTKASLKYQWVQEINKFCNLKVKEIKTPTAAGKKFEQQFEDVDMFVLNYETFKNKEVCKRLKMKKPETLIVDEIHYIGNRTAAKSKALHKFNILKYKIGLTATPITKNVENLFSIFKLLKKDLFPLYGPFEQNFLKLNMFKDVIGCKDEEGLKEIIKPYTFIKNNEEIAKQLPKLFKSKIECEMTPQLKKATQTLFELKEELENKKYQISQKYRGRKDFDILIQNNEEIKKIDNQVQDCMSLLQQVADDPYLIETSKSKLKNNIKITDKKSPKYDLLISILEDIYSENENEKVCIFTRFVRMQEELARRIENHFSTHTTSKDNSTKQYTFKCAIVNGQMNSKERYHQAYTLFQEDKDYKVLIATDAMNEGVSLSKCKYLIEYDLADSYAKQTQRHGRICRANSSSRISYVYQLISKDSWDENQIKIIDKKEKYDYVFFREDLDDENLDNNREE